jgi:cytochrome c
MFAALSASPHTAAIKNLSLRWKARQVTLALVELKSLCVRFLHRVQFRTVFRTTYMFRTVIGLLTSATLVIALSYSSQCQDLQRQGTDVSSGQLAFNNACRTCHSMKKDDNRLGPNLYKVLGRKAGSTPNYVYSTAMRDSDLVWDKTKLDNFIANPDAVVPGNKMKPYGGLASADVRAQVITFLESVSGGQ